MKKVLTLSFVFVFITSFVSVQAKDLQGTWSRTGAYGDKEINYVLLFSGNYFSWTAYYANDGKFIATKGGSFKTEAKKLIFMYEFDTADPEMVGRKETHALALKGKSFTLDNDQKWKQADAGKKSPISGSWLFAGRKRNGAGEIQRRTGESPRKTMKILTPTRFQWIAYNTETKKFFGTGGGSYTAVNGKYTENIEFFSRDNNRVGASLGFNFEVKDGEWHHSGKSSKGDPMYEVWAKRKK